MKYLGQVWRCLAFLFIYILLGIYALAFPSDTGWTLFLFASLVLVLEIFSLVGALKNILFTAPTYLLAHVNEPISVQFKMKKRQRKILWLANLKLTAPQYQETFDYLFYHGQKKQMQITWQPHKRGIVQQQKIHIIASDLFAWFKKESVNEFVVDWHVLPPIHSLGHVATRFFQKKLTSGVQNFGEHTFKIKKFRPYQAGDRLSQIDWKISSKQQELVLREYEQEEPREIIFLFYGSSSPYFELMLSLFYSVWKELPIKEVQFVLLGEQVRNQRAITEEDFSSIQPLEQEISLPDFGKRPMIVFIPEKKQQSISIPVKQQVEIYDYQQLMQQLKE
ncbi:hypothetical protein GCM10025886_26340 [Tetragenococcus halophilus subsp. flandriensis]|uniref:DUF58 domain-containing protein n=1 Tax=Tetragenococcus halophilus TaxID=51669 RepID=UPI0023E97035|nr:DUF58 domain-containing protein [Tetragenococcus halophilus]GMA09481.1 hypothetical protein GCM10025886_26340 [Tetragenococcus halophilus subsp. flandriensis]